MEPNLFTHFQKSVSTNSVVAFDAAVEKFLAATPGSLQMQVQRLSSFFVELQSEFNTISRSDSVRYTQLFVQWMGSDIISTPLLEELFVNQSNRPWRHLLAKDDNPKHFEKIDITRLFSTTQEHCQNPETLDFLSQLVSNHSCNCFTYFLNHDFVAPIFRSKPPTNEGLNWNVTAPHYFNFFEATLEFYTRHINVIDPQWIVNLLDAIQEREDYELIKDVCTNIRFQKWIRSSNAFHEKLLTTPLFSVDVYPSLLQWLPSNHHFALRKSVLANEMTRLNPDNPKHIDFIASVPESERIEHLVSAWQKITRLHNNRDIFESKYIVPTINCLSEKDIDQLISHPWMEHAGPVVRTSPRVQKHLLASVIENNAIPTRSKKI